MEIQFRQASAIFSEGPNNAGELIGYAKVDFDTNILKVDAVLKSFKLGYKSKHYVRTASVRIEDVSGAKRIDAKCKVVLQLEEDDPQYPIDPKNSSAEVLFIAVCGGNPN